MPTVTLSETVYRKLQSLAEPFRDTPETVIQRLLDEHEKGGGATGTVPAPPSSPDSEGHMRNEDFHHAIVAILDRAGASGRRPREVITELERQFAGKLSKWDIQKEPKGMIRWKHRVYDAKEDLKQWGLIVSVNGRWQITEHGQKAFKDGTI